MKELQTLIQTLEEMHPPQGMEPGEIEALLERLKSTDLKQIAEGYSEDPLANAQFLKDLFDVLVICKDVALPMLLHTEVSKLKSLMEIVESTNA